MRVGYYATNFGRVPPAQALSGAALMRETGQNTDNLAFSRAAAGMIQDELTLLPWGWNGRDGRDDLDMLMIPAANYLNPEWDFAHFAATFARVAGYFADADGWIQDLRRRDCSYTVNTRIHGTILAMMAEIPSLVVGHDARIRELCSVMGIPCLSAAATAAGLKDIPGMFRRLDFDGNAFDQRRRDLARLYRDYLVAGGLTPSRNLATLCGDAPRRLRGAAA